jgi:hypothetical protein
MAAQEQDGWQMLSRVSFSEQEDPLSIDKIQIPAFAPELKALEGKSMQLTGYVIPLEASAKQSFFVLSRFPYQSCFFCGAAGPETVVEVYADLSNPKADERVTVAGKLVLNEDDPLHLFYQLEDAEVIDR